MNTFQLLVTKKINVIPEPPSGMAINIEAKEFIGINYIDTATITTQINKLISKGGPVIFTSRHAILAVRNHLGVTGIDSKIFCLEGKTQELAAESFGRDKISGVAANAAELAELIRKTSYSGELVFFCGNKRRDELPGILSANNIPLQEVVVYETKLTPVKVSPKWNGICFFSPSAVESFFSINALDKETVCFSIGKTTSAELAKKTANVILTTEQASEKSMFSLVFDFIKKNDEQFAE